jgi:hypothetical protein
VKDSQVFNILKALGVKELNGYREEYIKTFQREATRSWNFFVKTLPQEKLRAL